MITEDRHQSTTVRFSYKDKERGDELGHVYLYLIRNDKHERPYGLVEDLEVKEKARGKGIGTSLMQALIERAVAEHCYKIVANSRTERRDVHKLYKRLGFDLHGLEFRMDF